MQKNGNMQKGEDGGKGKGKVCACKSVIYELERNIVK